MTKKGTYKVVANADQCELYITGFIGSYDIDRLEALCNQQVQAGQTNICIFLDSFGGDAFTAQRIGNTIDKFKGEVTCHVGLIAASSASYILAKCAKRSIAANGQIMFHKPMIHGGGNIDEVAANLKMLKAITKDFATVYATLLSKTAAEIDEMWTNDYWMDAEEALELGFVTEIGAPVEMPDMEVVAELTTAGRWTAPIVEAKTEQTTTNHMKELPLVKAALSLPEDSSEVQVLAAVNAAVKRASDAEARVTALEAEATARQENAVKVLVEAAVKENKITEAERERYTKLATADFENTALVLADRKPHVTANSQLNNGGGANDKYADWSYEKLSREAPQVLAQLKVNEPEKFAALRAEFLKK